MDDIIRELEDIFGEVEKKDTMFENLPNGEYLAEISEIKVGESKMGKPMVTFVFKVTYGEHEGRTHRKFMLLSGKDEKQLRANLHRYAQEAKRLGVDTSKGLDYTLEKIQEISEVAVKLKISTTLSKSGDEWTNTTFELV